MNALAWLLLPLGAAYVFFSLPRRSDAAVFFPAAAAPGADDVAPAAAGDLDPLGVGALLMTIRKVFTLPPSAAPYADAIAAAESRYGLPDSLLARVLYQESRFRPDVISGKTSSPAGAQGIAQFMPATAADFGIDPLNPQQAIDAAGRYLRQLYDRFGDWSQALAAYNWGQGNVARKGLERAPTETRNYVRDILGDVEVS